MLRCSIIWLVAVCCSSLAFAQSQPRNIVVRAGIENVKPLQQNWSDEESAWFYHAAQGSRLIPYRWFLHLEQADSQTRFLDPSHILQLGYIPREKTTDNEDGLPIGFAKDASYNDGTKAVGVTCAACHTTLMEFGDTAYLIDGGPTLGDMETFMKRLVASMMATRDQEAKFNRFADVVLETPSADAKNELRERLTEVIEERRGYNERNFPQSEAERFGHGRIDAFGAILNEVSSTFLGLPGNRHKANAPVSYPFLWDAPQHEKVQWNGGAQNTVSKLGKVLVGTEEMGALGRNAGEVLGVFGHVEIVESDLRFQSYPSTVNKPNLIKIENTLKTLWSPEWPAEFGSLDPAKLARGEAIYDQKCVGCHARIQRDDPKRVPNETMRTVGTDPQLWINLNRNVETGLLEGRFIRIKDLLTALKNDTLEDPELRFGETAPVANILSHVVERSILNTPTDQQFESLVERKQRLINGLQAGYQAIAFVKNKDTEVEAVPYDAITSVDNELVFTLAKGIKKRARRKLAKLLGDSQEELRTPAFAYKARPLNGIWATAPYLHNGSVPTLADLLKPADERPKTFHVGSPKFDPVKVGFVDDDSFPVFNTEIDGNGNQGHEFAAGLNETQREDLLEYLKSL